MKKDSSKMQNILTRFETIKPLIPCYMCGKHVAIDDLSSIRINTTNGSRHYKGSKRKMIHNYNVKLCPNCFTKMEEGLNQLVYAVFKENRT